jgi:hypothetical protein
MRRRSPALSRAHAKGGRCIVGGIFVLLNRRSGKTDGLVVSVRVCSFNGILRGRNLSVVFYGSRDLSVLQNQFSQDCISYLSLFPYRECIHLYLTTCSTTCSKIWRTKLGYLYYLTSSNWVFLVIYTSCYEMFFKMPTTLLLPF